MKNLENKQISVFIKKEDYIKLQHAIFLRNDTSSTFVKDDSKISFVKMFEKGVSLRLPISACGVGHLISLFIFKLPMKKKFTIGLTTKKVSGAIECVGKVDGISKIDGARYEVVADITFGQWDEEAWKTMIQQYKDLQDRIDDFGKSKVG